MSKELQCLTFLISAIAAWCFICVRFTQITPVVQRKITVAECLDEIFSIMDNATEYAHLNCTRALVEDFKYQFEHTITKTDMAYYLDIIAEEKKKRIVEIVAAHNQKVIRMQKNISMVS